MKNRKLQIKKVGIVIAALLGIVIAVLHSAYVNMREMEKQLQQNLADVARQNAVILETKISTMQELITALSKELEGVTVDTIGEKLDHFAIFLEVFHLKRFAYCFPDGTTYSTDNGFTNLSYREFYQKGMQGESYITGVLADALREEHTPVNVMTIPVYEADEICGVFGVAYDTKLFNEALQIESFDGQGYSCIVNEAGEIMASSGNDVLELSGNIFDDILQNEPNKQRLTELQSLMQKQETGCGVLYLSEKSYYCCVPVQLMDGCVTWYILTIVPSEILGQRVVPIQWNQYFTSFLVVAFVAIGAALLVVFLKEQHKEQISYAYEDSLTKGPNFVKFCMDMGNRENRNGYLIALDITNFNNIMIAAGEKASNSMIKETWEILSASIQKDEMAARVKDDMFLMFLTSPDKESLLHRMEQISEKIGERAKEFRVYGIQAGYGIYRMVERESVETAYSKAKLAREYAALNPEQQYAFYSELNRVKTQHERQLEESFPQAIAGHEFEVWYQPKYSAAEGKVVGSEALVRWRRENGDMISPGEFIPLFEKNGMIMKLDEYMFRSVCLQQKRWLEEGKKMYPVSINISRASLYRADVEQRYKEIMQECGIAPKYIQLEVTETVMEDKKDIRELLNKFRQIGIKILMDDFGTGYSSLATLSTQCFDTLKLDKTLIDHIGSKDGDTLLYHVIRMGQQMGLSITAEGVEQQSQVEFLRELKCDDIQGFYFSRPLPLKEFEEML